LILAAGNGFTQIANSLIKAGANLKLVDKDGQSALNKAAIGSQIAEML
jgi:ankyrin repeat protein